MAATTTAPHPSGTALGGVGLLGRLGLAVIRHPRLTAALAAPGAAGHPLLPLTRPFQSTLPREPRRAIPDVYAGFGELHRAAPASGALGTRAA